MLDVLVWLAAVARWRAGRIFLRQELRHLRDEIRHVLVARAALELHAGCVRRKARRRFARIRTTQPRFTRRHVRRYVLRGVKIGDFAAARRVLGALDHYADRCVRNLCDGIAERFAPCEAADIACQTGRVCNRVTAPDTS